MVQKTNVLPLDKLKGGETLIKNAYIKDGIATVEYFADYEQYKQASVNHKLTKDLFDTYWNTGDAVIKALIDGSTRLLKEVKSLNKVKVIKPYEGKTYSIEVEKSDLMQFLKCCDKLFEEHYDEYIQDKHIYNKQGRKQFFDRFGSVK